MNLCGKFEFSCYVKVECVVSCVCVYIYVQLSFLFSPCVYAHWELYMLLYYKRLLLMLHVRMLP